MSQERTEAIVLRGVDFSESSRIVTLLSPDRGRLVCMAKGVKRPKSQLAGLLDTFNRLEVVYYWKDSREVQQLGDVTLLDAFPAIKHDLDKSTYAAFPLELAAKTAHDNEPSAPLFRSLYRGLGDMEKSSTNPRTHAAWQALRLLEAGGFAPEFDACVRCGRETPRAADFAYDGGAACANCRPDAPLTVPELAKLKALSAADAACPSLTLDTETFTLLGTYASRQLDTTFRSLRVIQQMYS